MCFPSNCGGRNRTCGHVVQGHVFLPTETTPQVPRGSRTRLTGVEARHLCRSARGTDLKLLNAEGEGVEPSRRTHARSTVFETAAIASWLVPPIRRRSRNCRVNNSTCDCYLPPFLVRRPTKVFPIVSSHPPWPVPHAAVAGIEPASERLTTACPYQHRPHRIVALWQTTHDRYRNHAQPRK